MLESKEVVEPAIIKRVGEILTILERFITDFDEVFSSIQINNVHDITMPEADGLAIGGEVTLYNDQCTSTPSINW